MALIYSSEAGRREATIAFDVGQGTQDLGFRAEVPVLFTVKPAVAVKLEVLDHDGTPTTGRFQFVDGRVTCFRRRRSGWRRICSSRNRSTARTARHVLLPPGELTMFYGRGPEYRWLKRTVDDSPAGLVRTAPPSRCGSSAGSIRRHTASTAAIITSTPRVARTTPRRPKAWIRRTCSGRSRAKGSTSAAC